MSIIHLACDICLGRVTDSLFLIVNALPLHFLSFSFFLSFSISFFPPSSAPALFFHRPSITDDILKDLFAGGGYTVKAFKFFQ